MKNSLSIRKKKGEREKGRGEWERRERKEGREEVEGETDRRRRDGEEQDTTSK